MAEPDTVVAPLAGVRVLDLTTGPVEVFGRQFIDMGAQVTRARVHGITRDEQLGPFIDGVALGSAMAALGADRLSVDPTTPEGAGAWARVLERTDILIENTKPGSPEEAALDIASIRTAHPSLVVLSISDFGRQTPFSRWKLTTPVSHALTSELSRSGLPGREPLLPPFELPYDVASSQAALTTLAIYLDRMRTGLGALIDFAVVEGAMQALDPPGGSTGSAAAGASLVAAPRGRTDERHRYPILKCADGYVRICILAARQWKGMFEWMGSPEEFAAPEFADLRHRFATPRVSEAIGEFFADKTRLELETQGQLHGVPIAQVLDLEEALTSEQVLARGFFRDVHLGSMSVPVPAGVVVVDGGRSVHHEPSASSEHWTEAPIFGSRDRGPGDLPLAGLRVLDFGVIIVGGDTGRLFGDLGAEVIKVENSAFLDGSRAAMGTSLMADSFAASQRNKRSIGVNLRDPRGRQIIEELVRASDVVLTNYKPGVARNLGLDFETVKKINPAIVVVDSSAFGPTGPWAQRLGYGPLVRAAAGFTSQWVYEGQPESFSDAVTVYPDHVCARIGVMSALALLIRREATGTGGSASIAQSEVMMSHMATDIAREALRRDGHEVTGDIHDVPWGLYAAAGDDEWLVVTVRDDAEWTALCGVLGREDLRADDALGDSAGRIAQRDRIEDAVREWARRRDPKDAMTRLQEAGVPAGAMLRAGEVPEWAYFRDRRDFCEIRHPLLAEPTLQENRQVHACTVADPPMRPAPLLGDETYAICAEILGMSAEAVSELVEAGALEVTASPVTAA